ncbi:MAG: DUF362 domain-containing protein [Thermodesulfobacteriota bacterium]|nr:DUF362 domain-containing protein [Thermodesulfobacteriota bacterium]
MTSEIYCSKTEQREEFIARVLEKIWKNKQDQKVFVKPNVVSYEKYPTTTHPKTLQTVLEFLLKQGCEVIVGDGPAPDAGKSSKILHDHPLTHLCSSVGVDLLNIHKRDFQKIHTSSGFKLEVSKIPFAFDTIISLPVLKTHFRCDITGALKNQFGLLSNTERIIMHFRIKDIHRGIAELNTIFKPDIIIMDAIYTYKHGQEERHGGKKVKLGYMLAGSDPVALDCKGLSLLKDVEPKLVNKNPEDIGYIAWAMKLGVGDKGYTEINI